MRDIIFKSVFFIGAVLICILFLPSLLMPKKIVPGLPKPSGRDFKGFLGNSAKNNVTKLPKMA